MTNLSPLAAYFETTTAQLADLGDSPGRFTVDSASDLAIEIITLAGYNYESIDDLGVEVNDDVQALLQLLILRAPRLGAHLAHYATR